MTVFLRGKLKVPRLLYKICAASAFLCAMLVANYAQAQITGSVFRDFNGNGTKDTNEPYVAGVMPTVRYAAQQHLLMLYRELIILLAARVK